MGGNDETYFREIGATLASCLITLMISINTLSGSEI
jgi:hypothetical protein